jgi:hypothetical protein
VPKIRAIDGVYWHVSKLFILVIPTAVLTATILLIFSLAGNFVFISVVLGFCGLAIVISGAPAGTLPSADRPISKELENM